jgi:DtxR family Mn-dependent transcriptional regulator
MLSKLRYRAKNEVVGGGPAGNGGRHLEKQEELTREQTDHLLEQLWVAQEDQRLIPAQVTGDAPEHACSFQHTDDGTGCQNGCDVTAHLPYLKAAGLVEEVDGAVRLSETGVARAEELIRRHRLTELLLTELLDVDTAESRPDVCRLEHAISPPIVERICAFLGHPPHCPHGRPIPRGRCCGRITREVPPLVAPLEGAAVGQTYRVVFIAPKSHLRLDRLAVLGLTPGAQIRLHQKRPSYVIRIGETDVAIDPDIAREIYVRPV